MTDPADNSYCHRLDDAGAGRCIRASPPSWTATYSYMKQPACGVRSTLCR